MTDLKLIPHTFQSPIRTTTQHHKGTNPRKNCSNFIDPCEQTGCTCISHLVRLLFDVSQKLSKEQEKLKVSSLGSGGIFHQRAKTISNAKNLLYFISHHCNLEYFKYISMQYICLDKTA